MTDITTTDLDEDVRIGLKAATARRRLEDLPELVAHIRTLVVPTLGGAKDGMPRAASKEPPLPMRADAADDADAVWRQLVDWVDYWAGVFDVKPPAAAQAAWRNDADDLLGFRPHVTPPGAGHLTKYLVDWLLVRHDDIAGKVSGELYYDDVSNLQGERYDDDGTMTWFSIAGKYPRAARRQRPVLPRPCPVCDHFAYGAEWPDGGRPEDVVLRCDVCGHEDDTALLTSRTARQVVVELREERQTWDRAGVLAFYDEHGYYPTEEEPLDKRRQTSVCGAITYRSGRTLVCTLSEGHSGAHSGPGAEGERERWEPKYETKGQAA